jgi:hypothetical protein
LAVGLDATLSDEGEERISFLSLNRIDGQLSPIVRIYLSAYANRGIAQDRKAIFKLLLHHFGVAAEADLTNIECFLMRIDRNGPITLAVHNVPRAFKVECETKRECVAVFPNGRRMPLAEAEKLEAEEAR